MRCKIQKNPQCEFKSVYDSVDSFNLGRTDGTRMRKFECKKLRDLLNLYRETKLNYRFSKSTKPLESALFCGEKWTFFRPYRERSSYNTRMVVNVLFFLFEYSHAPCRNRSETHNKSKLNSRAHFESVVLARRIVASIAWNSIGRKTNNEFKRNTVHVLTAIYARVIKIHAKTATKAASRVIRAVVRVNFTVNRVLSTRLRHFNAPPLPARYLISIRINFTPFKINIIFRTRIPSNLRVSRATPFSLNRIITSFRQCFSRSRPQGSTNALVWQAIAFSRKIK